MFVWSLKTSKRDILLLILGIAAFIFSLLFALLPMGGSTKTASASGGVPCTAENSEQRIKFLQAFGWEVSSTPSDVREIIIPLDFTDVYEKYNQLQRQQGFNLENYKGKRVKLWSYEVTNYPEKTGVYANLLVYEGEIIGGDICSYELEGFMHGFNAESAETKISYNEVFALI